jgi:hypothetical protein
LGVGVVKLKIFTGSFSYQARSYGPYLPSDAAPLTLIHMPKASATGLTLLVRIYLTLRKFPEFYNHQAATAASSSSSISFVVAPSIH